MYIHSCCLPCNYVTTAFGIIRVMRVIKSQRVYIYHLDSAKADTFSLKKVRAAKFSEMFKFKFSGLIKTLCSFQERNASTLSIWENVLTLQTVHRNFLIIRQTVSSPYINFLIRKQKRYQKLIQKFWSNRLSLSFLDMFCLLHKQTKVYSQINR